MKRFRSSILLLAIVLVAGATFTVHFARGGEQEGENGQGLQLQRPAFVDVAHAEEANVPADIGQRLDEEAGISAYFEAGEAIDLDQVRGEFTTIEIETSDYILGSVAVPDYNDVYDTHVYVHTDGRILAYYPNDTAVSKIVDV